ncbi:hypothetical protein [Clostridioides difficile]|nr:hypothetical protein [Clostridioides difficile]MCJ0406237.1 hypothetical protein [Clostridioides difficile]MDC2930494.1 hypothetical protein [Clostridioides difficile]MDE3610714.1 hypothetical protein [Clostridioides difficile]MDM9791702.1 hypothetical protein [Clostridioides difficile]MDO0135570.1 hypothetical protein [Clostridioides difficile]
MIYHGVLAGKNKSPVMIVEKLLYESQKNLVKSKRFDKITKVGEMCLMR